MKRKGELEFFVGRRYGDFSRFHKRMRTELPGKVLPPMPRKNKKSSTASNLYHGVMGSNDDDDASSISSVSTMGAPPQDASRKTLSVIGKSCFHATLHAVLTWSDHRKSGSQSSFARGSPRSSVDGNSPLSPISPRSPNTGVCLPTA